MKTVLQALAVVVGLCLSPFANADSIIRARELGIPFDGKPGPWNSITDVPGIEVGYATLIQGDGPAAVRTGVTAIHPRGRTLSTPVLAGTASLNGNGEMTGTAFIEEFGWFSGPILLTNTDSLGVARDTAIAWQLQQAAFKDSVSELPVVAETWDGYLNDIYGFHVKAEHILAALNGARSGPITEGNVGGGTGMICHQFKCGTGTSSRRLDSGYTVGVLVQANYGSRETLTIAGVPIGQEIPAAASRADLSNSTTRTGSIIAVVATDAPLLSPALRAMAKRAIVGLARVGGIGQTASGDLFLAFSTANNEAFEATAKTRNLTVLNDNKVVNQLYVATAQATEEAIVNSMIAAKAMTGIRGRTIQAIPQERVQELLRKYNRFGLP